MEDENKQAREEYLALLDIDYTATFVPQSASRNRNDKRPTLNWIVTLTHNGTSLTLDYTQGIAHVPGYDKLGYRGTRSVDEQALFDRLTRAAETGKYPTGVRAMFMMQPLPPPSRAEVMSSILLDASAIDDTFEDWCSNFGADTDSRKAKAMYDACVDTGIRLRRMIGDEAIAKLRELFQDY